MTYMIRDSNGILKAQMPDSMALHIIDTGCGHFRKCTFESSYGNVGYEIDEPIVHTRGDMKIYFWEGDVLYKSAV